MDGQVVAQEATSAGVTETTEAPESVDTTPVSSEADSSNYESAQGDSGNDETQKPANVRIQKLANEARRYREQVQKYEQEMKALEGAKYLDQLLRQNPQQAREVMELLQGKATPSQQEEAKDLFEGYLPHEAEALRAAMEWKQWRQEQEQRQQQHYQQSIQENNSKLEGLFEERLKKDGFVSKDGSFDKDQVKMLSSAVLIEALSIAQNPQFMTEKELNLAYENALKATKSFEKRALKNTVKSSPPPLSASQRGAVPIGKTKENEAQRLARMVKEFTSARG